MRTFVSISLFLLLLLSGPACAKDLASTWKYSNGSTMTLSVRDDNHIRMDTTKDSYTLFINGKTYLVTRDEDGWTARDMDKISAMMGGMSGMFGGKKQVNLDDYKTTYKYLGRKETVAGYQGKVYQVKVQDKAGKQVSSDEVVLSKNEDIYRINMAMASMGSKMSSMASSGMSFDPAVIEKQAEKYGSTLRYGKDLTLVSVQKQTLEDALFQLPREGAAPAAPAEPDRGAAHEDNAAPAGNMKGEVGKLLKGLFK